MQFFRHCGQVFFPVLSHFSMQFVWKTCPHLVAEISHCDVNGFKHVGQAISMIISLKKFLVDSCHSRRFEILNFYLIYEKVVQIILMLRSSNSRFLHFCENKVIFCNNPIGCLKKLNMLKHNDILKLVIIKNSNIYY